MVRAQLKWMLQLLRWLNKKKKNNSIIFCQSDTPGFLKTITPAQNSPVSSPLKLLPTVLKTGYFHLNTTLEVAPPSRSK